MEIKRETFEFSRNGRMQEKYREKVPFYCFTRYETYYLQILFKDKKILFKRI